MIQTKRAYEPMQPNDGLRILVDRLWPRGIAKEDLLIDEWQKEISPSNELRRKFGHQPERWHQFLSEYFQELDDKQAYWEPIIKRARRHRVTLIYSARDTEHNNAQALKQYLDSKLKRLQRARVEAVETA